MTIVKIKFSTIARQIIFFIYSQIPYSPLSSFSNFGTEYVDIAAPGESIAGTPSPNTGHGVFSTSRRNSYEFHAGTSFAAPLVSGAAALVTGLLRSNGRAADLSPSLVEALITQGSRTQANLSGKVRGSRSLDLKGVADLANQPPAQIIVQQPSSKKVVVGENVTLRVQPYGPLSGLTYQWLKNNSAISGATEQEYTIEIGRAHV